MSCKHYFVTSTLVKLAHAESAAKEHKDESVEAKKQIEKLKDELREEKDALRDSLKNGEMQAQEIDRLKSDFAKTVQVGSK